jgi:hypothetical protein
LADERLSSEAVFIHGKEFLGSISLGLKKFDVYENKTETADLHHLNKYEEMSSTYLYDSHTEYSLKHDPSNYRNLDNENHMLSFGTIREYEDNHIVQCGYDKSTADGTILVGSSHGSWARDQAVEQDVARTLGNLMLHPVHLATRIDKGLTLLRKVTRTEMHYGIGSEVCSKLYTESIHPLELFSTMRITTIGESPFQHVYSKVDPTQRRYSPGEIAANLTDTSSSSLESRRFLLQPDFLPHCVGTGDSSSSYSLGYTQGCLEFNYALPGSFNSNYDPSTGDSAMSAWFICW